MKSGSIGALRCIACVLFVLFGPLASAQNIGLLVVDALMFELRGILRGAALAGRTQTLSLVARREAAVSLANESRLARLSGARFCVRITKAPGCHYRKADSAQRAVEIAFGPPNRVRKTDKPNVFDIIDAAGTLVDIVEVLDRESPQNDPAALEPYTPPAELMVDPEYDVACGPGFAPSPYTREAEGFSNWSCSGGGGYYNAYGVCPPDKTGWKLWTVKGTRLLRSISCDDPQSSPRIYRNDGLPPGTACGPDANRMACPSLAIPGTDCRRCQ
jgi:hypothetical protein